MGSQTKPSWKREAKFYRGEWERAYQGERDLMALLFRRGAPGRYDPMSAALTRRPETTGAQRSKEHRA